MAGKQEFHYNPFDNTLQGYVNAIIKREIYNVQTCIPAIVKSVESRGLITATPAVQQTNSDWESFPWADVRLPVYTPFGGGIIISSPVTVGDTGWIIAGDLDPSLFLADKSRPQKQNTYDRHKYQFGFFIPDAINGYSISAEDNDSLVIQTRDGATKITLKDGKVDVKSSADLNINAKNVKINGSTKVTINNTDWATHTHSVGELRTTATVGASSTPGTITGNTGGVA